jgi:hypothetical protein
MPHLQRPHTDGGLRAQRVSTGFALTPCIATVVPAIFSMTTHGDLRAVTLASRASMSLVHAWAPFLQHEPPRLHARLSRHAQLSVWHASDRRRRRVFVGRSRTPSRRMHMLHPQRRRSLR